MLVRVERSPISLYESIFFLPVSDFERVFADRKKSEYIVEMLSTHRINTWVFLHVLAHGVLCCEYDWPSFCKR